VTYLVFVFYLLTDLSLLSINVVELKINDSFYWHNLFSCSYTVLGPEFRERGFFGRMFYILLFAALQRQKYYFAWKLGMHS